MAFFHISLEALGARMSRAGIWTGSAGDRRSDDDGETAMEHSTTPEIPGRRADHCLGVVTGEAIVGANIFKDLFASIRDIVGGRSAAYEEELAKARRIAFEEMDEQARRLGANAVVGIDIDYETVGQSMLMVAVSGTAVVVS